MNTLLEFPVPFLSDGWRDLITLTGLFATIVTVLAFILAIYQIRKIQSAAEASIQGEKNALTEIRKHYDRFAAANAHHLVRNVKVDVQKQQWDLAAIRLSDLADQLAQLVGTDESWRSFIDRLRKWEASCHRLAVGKLKRFSTDKWIEFTGSLQSKIDDWIALFPSDKETKHDPKRKSD